MTICISAICTEKGQDTIVFSVDHMISTGLGQFEHDINKFKLLNDNTVGMIAGNALLMDYFLDDDYSQKTYSEIQKILQEKFKQKRLETIEREVLDIFSIDYDFQSSILKSISQTNLNTAILLMGFEDGKAKICEVGDAGIEDYNQINFNTIGSGSIQAQNTLLFQHHSKHDDLKTTLYNVYKSKKNAEVMQGVRKETEIGYLNENGITMLTKEDIRILDDIYYIELNYGKEHQKLNDLMLEGEI